MGYASGSEGEAHEMDARTRLNNMLTKAERLADSPAFMDND